MSFKILIVEDEELYADKLEMLVDKLDYEHLATVDNSKDALSLLEKVIPDLILMDVHIRGEHDGIELAGLIQKDHLKKLGRTISFFKLIFLLKPDND